MHNYPQIIRSSNPAKFEVVIAQNQERIVDSRPQTYSRRQGCYKALWVIAKAFNPSVERFFFQDNTRNEPEVYSLSIENPLTPQRCLTEVPVSPYLAKKARKKK